MNIQTAVFLLFSYVCELLIFLFYSRSFLQEKISIQKIYVITSITYFVMFIFSLFDKAAINTILYIVFNALLFAFFFDGRWYKAFLHTLILTFLMGTSEFLTLILLQRYTLDYYNETYILQNRIIYALISKLIFFIVVFLVSRLFGKKTKFHEITKHFSLRLYIVPFISLFMMLIVIMVWTNDFSIIANLPTTLFIPIITILTILLNILVYWDEYNRIKRASEKQSLILRLQHETDMCNYYQKLLQETEYRSALIHDIKNHLQSIQSLVEMGDTNSTREYINNLLESPALSQFSKRSDNDLLNALLSRYEEECNKLKISFDTDIRSKTISFLSNEDITTLFGNMMDNAIEAAKETSNPFIDLIIESRLEDAFTLIKLRNSYNGQPLKYDSSGMIVTSKGDNKNHGFGLKSIQSVINKYDGDMHYIEDEDTKVFTMIFSLKNLGDSEI